MHPEAQRADLGRILCSSIRESWARSLADRIVDALGLMRLLPLVFELKFDRQFIRERAA